MSRYVFTAFLVVDAPTLEAAETLLMAADDISPLTTLPGGAVCYVESFVETIDETEPACTCRPGLVERGGFSSRCPRHGVG